MDDGPMTATEVRRRQLEWGQDISGFFSKARRAAVEDDKEALRKAIDSQESIQIYKYCYARAIRKDINAMISDLTATGTHRQEMTDEKAVEILGKMTLWSARIMRWWGIEQ